MKIQVEVRQKGSISNILILCDVASHNITILLYCETFGKVPMAVITNGYQTVIERLTNVKRTVIKRLSNG